MDTSGQQHTAAALHPGERSYGTPLVRRSWTDPTAGLDDSEEKKNLLPLPAAHLIARSVVSTLYRLHYTKLHYTTLHYNIPAASPMKFKAFTGCANLSDMFVFSATSK